MKELQSEDDNKKYILLVKKAEIIFTKNKIRNRNNRYSYYYEIKWIDLTDNEHTGYSSFKKSIVKRWYRENFRIVGQKYNCGDEVTIINKNLKTYGCVGKIMWVNTDKKILSILADYNGMNKIINVKYDNVDKLKI